MKPVIEFQEKPRRQYTLDGIVVPSVTQILGCLEKGGLIWWGQGVAVEAVLELVDEGQLIWVDS